jgi:hypothetical protein
MCSEDCPPVTAINRNGPLVGLQMGCTGRKESRVLHGCSAAAATGHIYLVRREGEERLGAYDRVSL